MTLVRASKGDKEQTRNRGSGQDPNTSNFVKRRRGGSVERRVAAGRINLFSHTRTTSVLVWCVMSMSKSQLKNGQPGN